MRRMFDVRFVLLAIGSLVWGQAAHATPAITMDVATGEVLYQQEATRLWYPASTTKLMTVYVALSAVRDHQMSMDTPLVVSARARAMPPSKMGFAVGTQVTLDNALKILMVRSANDTAITVAEGVAGSVEAFADDMNRAAAELGMHESHFVNPNGLPAADHYSSARDMAILARALYTQFPEHAQLFNIGELSLGREIIGNHNNLLGRYPDADGMKTGFTCAAGFNIVASASRGGRRLVVVVFGAPSVATRSEKVAALFDRGFAGIDRPSASVLTLAAANDGGPPDMHDAVCRARSHLIAEFNQEVAALDAPLTGTGGGGGGLGLSALNPERALLFSSATPAPTALPMVPTATMITSMPQPAFEPVPIHIGAEPGYAGAVAQARAPHTPIGSEPQPATATAYAPNAPEPPTQGIGGTPLSVDANALPMHGRKIRAARGGRHGRPAMKAAAEAPKTKVLAGAEDKDGKAIGDADDGKRAKSAGKKAPKAAKATPPKSMAGSSKTAAAKTTATKTAATKTSKPKSASKAGGAAKKTKSAAE